MKMMETMAILSPISKEIENATETVRTFFELQHNRDLDTLLLLQNCKKFLILKHLSKIPIGYFL